LRSNLTNLQIKNLPPSGGRPKTSSLLLPLQNWHNLLGTVGLILLVALPRLTALNQYLIVDEADRWRWAEDFVYALSRGDLAGTLVGDGYPGIVPIWAESIWILLEAARRSLTAGQWIGEPGLYLIFHEWERSAFLYQQRLPIVLLNVVLALAVIGSVWRLFGRRIALTSGVLIALNPFYLSDSRVNRAEAVITGLITLSILALIFYYRQPRWRYVAISGLLGGLSFLTKIQALAILPAVALIGLFIYASRDYEIGQKKAVPYALLPAFYALLKFGLLWAGVASLTWVLLWPAMWVKPLETLALVYDYTTRKVGAEGVNLFFMGQTYADADPGPSFYPFVFLMRITPLALLGLFFFSARLVSKQVKNTPVSAPSFTSKASLILLIYILVYSLAMTVGSHKQDRYLMPIFLSIDILAGIGLVSLWDWLKKRLETRPNLPTTSLGWALFIGLLVIQLATILPHHPYYYSYFNPLLGGGQTAVQTLRIGWGEGMDQVGEYLAAKPDSRNLVVASRFTHNMLGFKGEQISLLPNGRWTQADYVVLYIQQVQRRQEPSPGFIDYFQARIPEKIITIAGIDYAWIYPLPFTTPADPQVSIFPDQAALLGYSWEAGQSGKSASPPTHQPSLRLLWENLGLPAERQLVARLVGETAQSSWAACQADPAFLTQAQTPGAYVESLCIPTTEALPVGFYTVEFGLAAAKPQSSGAESQVEIFRFPQGQYATQILPGGAVITTPESERWATIARHSVPAGAQWLDRVYNSQLRLAAYQLEPVSPNPGEKVTLRLYWQAVRPIEEPLRLTVQLADSRLIALGRDDRELIPPLEKRWFPGEMVTVQPQFKLSSDLEAPLAAQVELRVMNQAEVELPATNSAGEPLDRRMVRFTIAPEAWPALTNLAPDSNFQPLKATWENGIKLQGYSLAPQPGQPGESLQVTLFWQISQPVTDNYSVFVHLLDEEGQITAQNDDLPRTGAYPVPWWQPGEIVEDVHPLALPLDLGGGDYRLIVGLYRPENGTRLLLLDGTDSFSMGQVKVTGGDN
jgi:hypothetical protein